MPRAVVPDPRRLLDGARYGFTLLRDTVRLWLECNAFAGAGSLAFYTLFSLAPVVIIAVTMIGLVFGADAAEGQIVAQLEEAIGEDAASAVEVAVAQSRLEQAGWFPTLIGLGALVIGATTVFAQMQQSLNGIWGVIPKPTRSGLLILVRNRVLSLTIVLSIGFVLMVSLVFGIALRALINFAGDWIPIPGQVLSTAEFLVTVAMIALLFATIFKVLPDVVLSWRDVMLGALVTALLFSVGRHAIATYLAYTATASTYGAAGSLVMLLLWVYYSSLILLFGAAFTRVHLIARGKPVIPRNLAVRVRNEIIEETGESP